MTGGKIAQPVRRQGHRLRRRELSFLLMAATIMPRALCAQQKTIPVIGYLNSTSPDAVASMVAAFGRGLGELGYVDGQNVAIEYRWAEGHYDRLPALAAELVDRKVDLIAAGGIPPALAAKNATATIPIVFNGSDPVERGLIVGLARPGNITGVGFLAVELHPKRLELVCEIVPQARRVALLVNPNNANAERVIAAVQDAARAKEVQLNILRASTASEIEAGFASVVQLHVGALPATPSLIDPIAAGTCSGTAHVREG
jgi:putative tryptophan/tyrosine transport system substrate-binding protein